MLINNVRFNKKEQTLYYAFVIAILLHIIFFYIGIKYPEIIAMMPSSTVQNNVVHKPLEFTFVDIPEKEMNIKQLNKDALPSDRDRVSAAVAPKHFDERASKLPEMHGKSANIVVPSQITASEIKQPQPNQEAAEKVESEKDVISYADQSAAFQQKSIDRKRLAESLKNLDRFIEHEEMRNNPTSSYEPQMPPDSDLWLDTQGVDLGPWARQVHIRVRNNWIIPMAAHLGFKGKVSIDFEVLRDGTIKNIIISSQSGIMSFDQAALNALAMSNPLPPLPEIYPKPILRGRFTFYYNMEPYEK